MILMSSAYPWSSYVMIEAVGLCDWYDGLYPRFPMESHRSRGSMNIVKRKGESVSPCRVPLRICIRSVLSCMVM